MKYSIGKWDEIHWTYLSICIKPTPSNRWKMILKGGNWQKNIYIVETRTENTDTEKHNRAYNETEIMANHIDQ